MELWKFSFVGLFILFALVIPSSLCSAVNGTFTIKEYSIRALNYKIAEVVVDFGKHVYKTNECDQSREGSELLPCVDDTLFKCIDNSSTRYPFHKGQDQFYIKLDPEKCNSVVIEKHDELSLSNFRVDVRSHTVLSSNSKARICCKQLRQLDWNGMLFIYVRSVITADDRVSDIRGTISVMSEEFASPLSVDQIDSLQVQLDCPSGLSHMTCKTNFIGDSGCTLLPASSDPVSTHYFFQYLPHEIDAPLTHQVNPNKLAFGIVLDRDRHLGLSLPSRTLRNSGCSITVDDLSYPVDATNATTEYLPLPTQDIFLFRQDMACDYEKYVSVIIQQQELRNTITDYEYEKSSSILGSLYTSSDYLGCKEHIKTSFFLQNYTSECDTGAINDHCCFASTASQFNNDGRCCLEDGFTPEFDTYPSLDSPELLGECQNPSCVEQALDLIRKLEFENKYECWKEEKLGEKHAASACWSIVLKPGRCALGDTEDFSQSSCAPPTICSPTQQCKVPCNFHDDCIFACGEDGYCTTIADADDTFYSYDYHNNSYFSQCLEKYSSTLAMLFTRRNVGLPDNATLQELEIALFKDREKELCTDDLLTDHSSIKSKEECEAEWCNWKISCSRNDPNCNSTCLPKAGEDTHFCGQLLPTGNYLPFTQHPYCAPAGMLWQNNMGIPDYDARIVCPSGCGSTNTSKVLINPLGLEFPYQSCDDPFCFTDDDETSCTGPDKKWFSGKIEGAYNGICVYLNATNSTTCPFNWQVQFDWITGKYNTEETCVSECALGNFDKDECICEGPFCNFATGGCNDFAGCVIPIDLLQSEGRSCESPLIWTPFGCLDPRIDDSNECSYVWRSKSQTKDECLKTNVCIDEKIWQIAENETDEHGRPIWLNTFKSKEVCESCNGTFRPYYRWIDYSHNPIFRELVWTEKKWIRPYTWRPLMKDLQRSGMREQWIEILKEKAKLVLKSELSCSYTKMNNLYTFVQSDCAGVGNSTSQFTDEKFLPMDIITSCTGLEFSQNVTDQGSFHSKTELLIDGGEACIETKLYLLPLSRYDRETQVQLTSSRIPSTQEEMRSEIFVKNKNDIVVGKVLKDGILFEPEFHIHAGVKFCFFLQDIKMEAPPGLDLKIIDLASTTQKDGRTVFVPLGISAPNNESKVCVDLHESKAFFVIGLEENWPSKTYSDTYTTAELIGFIISAFLSGALFFISVIEVVYYLRQGSVRASPAPILGLFCLVAFLFDRTLYFILLPLGALEDKPAVSVLFTELPALFLFSLFAVTTARWIAVYHWIPHEGKKGSLRRKKDPKILWIIAGVNLFLYALLFILVVVYFSVDDSPPELLECGKEIDDSGYTTKESVALAYKIIFFLICLAFVGIFLFYNYALSNTVTTKTSEWAAILQRMSIITVVCSVCLLAECALLLYDTLMENKSIVGVTVWLFFTGWIPSLLFIILLFPTKGSIYSSYGTRSTYSTKTRSTATDSKTAVAVTNSPSNLVDSESESYTFG